MVLREPSSGGKGSGGDGKKGKGCVRARAGYLCVSSGARQLGERWGATLDATAGLLEVIVVDANRELIVVRLSVWQRK